MGLCQWRLERQEAVSRCKARRDMAAEHVVYLRALRAMGVALLQFASVDADHPRQIPRSRAAAGTRRPHLCLHATVGSAAVLCRLVFPRRRMLQKRREKSAGRVAPFRRPPRALEGMEKREGGGCFKNQELGLGQMDKSTQRNSKVTQRWNPRLFLLQVS
uniref:DUF630 domain-containing protein n=1 Tax=Oryza sativa subsp. japonica TaxID=39947 RepID=Q8LNX2_ORYSJ|nr:hypothetical protein [Oryza sativa Japonica Group]